MGNEQSQAKGKGKKSNYASMPVDTVPSKSTRSKKPSAGSSIAVEEARPSTTTATAAAPKQSTTQPKQTSTASTGTLVDLSGPSQSSQQRPPSYSASQTSGRPTASATASGATAKKSASTAAQQQQHTVSKTKKEQTLSVPSGPGAATEVFKNALANPPAAPSSSQLHLNITGAVACEAVLQVSIRTPNLQAKHWVLYTAVPPITSFQVNGTVTASLPAPASKPPACKVIRNENGTELLQVVINVDEHRHCTSELRVDFRVTADLFARELIYDPSFTCPYQVALPEEVQASTRSTPTFNLSSPAFQALLKEFPSYYAPNVYGDEVVLFAQSVFVAIANNFSYHYDPKCMDRSLESILSSRKSDCAGLSILYCSILRNSGVPARCVSGRWIVQSEVETHVIAEFYVDQIGWIPVDVTLATRDGLVTKPDGRVVHFGDRPANFIATHTNFDLELDTVHFGKKSVMHLLNPPFWVAGTRGVLDGKQYAVKWTVTKAEQLQG